MWPFKKPVPPRPDAFDVEVFLDLIEAGVIVVEHKPDWVNFRQVPGLPGTLVLFRGAGHTEMSYYPYEGRDCHLFFNKHAREQILARVGPYQGEGRPLVAADITRAMQETLEAAYRQRLAELESRKH